jgi:hypothetical protein
MKDRRPGRRPRSGRRAGTHNQRPWLWVPAFAGTTRVGFVGFVSPKCAATAACTSSHDVKQPISFPRRTFAPGVCDFSFTHPESRGGWSAEKRSGARRNTRGARHVASKTRVNALMTRDARLSALHRGFALPLIPAQAGIQVLGPRFRGDERKETYATPRSAFRIVSRTRPQ